MRWICSPISVLLFILVAALGLRLFRLGQASFWLDEILTSQLSLGRGYAHLDFPQNQLIEHPVDVIGLEGAPPLGRIWTTLDRDVHPPLFYLLLRSWREIFGDGDAAIRMLSVMLSLSAIVMLYLAVQPLSGAAAALWACLLMALAGPQIEYAQENRSYMLLLTALLGAAAAAVRIEKLGANWLRCSALGIASLAALLTHYLAFPAIACMITYSCVRWRGRSLRMGLASFGIAALVFAVVWGPFMLEQLHGLGERIGFTAEGSNTAVQSLRRAAELPLRFFTQASIRPAWIGSVAVVLYLLPLMMLRRRPDLLLWWLWLVGYVSILLILDLIRAGRTLEIIRYPLAASPAVYALVGALLAPALGWRRHIVPALLGIACLAALPEAYVRWKADWRGLGQFFSERVEADDVLIVHSAGPDDWRARCLYVCLRHYSRRPTLPVAFLSEPQPAVLDRITGQDVWLLSPAYAVQDRPLLPGWHIVEMKGDPQAATLARLRPMETTQPRR